MGILALVLFELVSCNPPPVACRAGSSPRPDLHPECVVSCLGPAEDAAGRALHERAAARIAAYRAHVQKTADKAALAGQLPQAVEELARAYELFRAANDLESAAACRVDAADAQRLSGKFQPALELYADGQKLAEQAHAPTLVARAWIGRTLTLLSGTKDYEAAEASAHEAVRVASGLAGKDRLAEALALASEVAFARGQLSTAADWVEQAIALRADITDKTVLFHIYADRSAVGFEYARAPGFRPSLDFCARMADLAVKDMEQATALARTQGWDAATGACEQTVRRYRRHRELIEIQRGYENSLDIGFHPKKPSDVLVTQEFLDAKELPMPGAAALLDLIRQENREDTAVSNYLQAQAASLQGKPDEALAAYMRAVELLETDYRPLRDDTARGNLTEPRTDYYYWPMLHWLERKDVPRAFRLVEATRARQLSDLIVTRQKIELAPVRDRELYARLRDLRGKIMVLESLHHRGTREHYAARKAELERLSTEHRTLLEEIQRDTPALLELVTSHPAALSAVQASATEAGYDVLEYIVLDSQIIVWHIGSRGVHVRSVVLPRPALERKVAKLRQTLTNPRVKYDADTARELYLFLLEPVVAHTTTDHLVVIPHEDLYEVPFQVLLSPEGRYAGDRFQISYAPSAAVLQRLKATPSLAGSSVLAVAGPALPEAATEAAAIVAIYSRGSKAVPAEQATELYLKRACAAYDVVHVAAHGQFDAQEPMLSFVALTAGDSDDGKLTAAEMFALPLGRARLVTLSACETGRVSGVQSGEVMGIPRALLYAGAQAVLLSQWQVDSAATRAWMETFYRAAQESPPSQAARRASLELRQQPEYEHPYYWGAFWLVGR